MISKYPGTCCYCKLPTKAGVDEYEIESKASYHVECHENPKPTPECYAIAARLGYRQYTWEELNLEKGSNHV